MNSEGITLRVLKPIFLSFTKCILNVHVLKMKKKISQSTMCLRSGLKPNKAFYSSWILYMDSAIKIYVSYHSAK